MSNTLSLETPAIFIVKSLLQISITPPCRVTGWSTPHIGIKAVTHRRRWCWGWGWCGFGGFEVASDSQRHMALWHI